MPELTTEQLVAKVAEGVKSLEEKSKQNGDTTAETKALAQRVSDDLIKVNDIIAQAKTDNEEHKARIEHLEALGSKVNVSYTQDDLKEIALKGLMEEMQTVGRESKALFGTDKREVKSYVGADYTATDMTRGGVFITPQIMNEIVMLGMREFNPILGELNITTHNTSANVILPVKIGEGVGSWAGELQDAPQSAKPKWSSTDIPMHRYQGVGACTMEVLSGTTIDFRAQVLDDIIRELSNAQIDAFTNGSGIGKPEGFVKGGWRATPTATAGVAKFDDLVTLPNSIQAQYRTNAKFYLTREVMVNFLLEKSSGSGQYMQVFGLNGIGGVPTLAGQPFAIIPTLATAPTQGQTALYYGDLRKAYRGVQWSGSYMKRDEITSFANGVFEYAMARFAGGRVINAEAMAALTIK